MKSIQLKSHFLTSVLIMMMTLILVGCADAAAGPAPTSTVAPPVNLVVAGSGSTEDLLAYLSETYRQEHSNWSFEFLDGANSSAAVKGVVDGTLDLGALTRPLDEEELAQGVKYIPFGNNRIVFITSDEIAITKLTTQQVKDIFTGKITNWSEVGGKDAPIEVLVREEDDTNTEILREALFGEAAFADGTVAFDEGKDLDATLTRSSQAIGYVSLGDFGLEEEIPANIVIVDGLDPKDLNNNYPYAKPAGVVYNPANATKIQMFLDFITSEEARQLLAQQNIAPASN
jgi:phosphate transport system substrate-binding protein